MSNLCECGCGGIVNKTNRFITGHNSKGGNNPFLGKCHTMETRKKLSGIAKNRPPV